MMLFDEGDDPQTKIIPYSSTRASLMTENTTTHPPMAVGRETSGTLIIMYNVHT